MLLTNDDIFSIFRARRIVFEMLTMRSYTNIKGPNFTSAVQFKKFIQDIDNELCLSVTAENLEQKKVIVFFFETDKIGINKIRILFSIIPKETHCIFFFRKCFSHFARNELPKHIESYEIFKEGSFINPLNHMYVPKHIRLSEEEKQKIILKAGKKEYLPKIKKSDAVSKFLGFVVGDVIHIKRPTSEGYFTNLYRLVVE